MTKDTAIQLTDQQCCEFDREGWVFLPDLFRAEEITALKNELPGIFEQQREEVWRESNDEAVRTVFAAHTYNDVFARLGRHPRLIGPVTQLLEGPVYMHQYKINAKAAFDGGRLAMAPGLRHLGTRRRNARAACDEHRVVPG